MAFWTAPAGVSNLLAEIGGILGLWLGASFIGLLHVFSFFLWQAVNRSGIVAAESPTTVGTLSEAYRA